MTRVNGLSSKANHEYAPPSPPMLSAWSSNASKSLEEESGHKAEPDGCTDQLLVCVSNGRWEEALDLLSSVQVCV